MNTESYHNMKQYTDLSYEEQLESPEWRQKRRTVLKRDGYTCRMCGGKRSNTDTHSLEVHHRYYILNHYAWKYDDSALITLCKDCHELIHKTISPLIYTITGDRFIRMNFTPCNRCGGAGWFQKYTHVQGGICFRCNGSRYEELISSKNVDVDLYLTDDAVFDVIAPDPNWAKIEKLYDEARKHTFVKYGDASDFEKAAEMYKIAANNGHPKAQNNYACLLAIFRIVNIKDDIESGTILRYTAYSAMQGIHQAQSELYRMFNKGEGVPHNTNIAKEWKELSKQNQLLCIKKFIKDFASAQSEEERHLLLENLSPGDRDYLIDEYRIKRRISR